MDIKQLLQSRRSCRDFSPKKIPAETLSLIIDVARFAPTARNLQPWEFILVTEPSIINEIYPLVQKNAPFFKSIQACVAIFCKDVKYYLEDGCAATTYILLVTHALGLGSCWVAGDKKEYAGEVGKILDMPIEYKLVSLVALGYSSRDTASIEKRSCQDVVSWQHFSEKKKGV